MATSQLLNVLSIHTYGYGYGYTSSLKVKVKVKAKVKPPLGLSFRQQQQLRQHLHGHLRGPAPPSYKVTFEHEGSTRTLEVGPDESILERALDEGLSVPHDCKLGVCMTCPARLVSGAVDQSDGMLSDDVVERGYALLCASYPRSDCHIKTIPEEELLSLQLATAND
ncbi:Ferredoxin [Rhynchospora pubera]|uniref:Ferredoxin n=1 Tax=Rhynchospora pubera TaxID=906938 RepID=A0AAV8EYG3_9POAL|nr:Ferredoxin [Rhynchospora pubera]